MTSLTLSLRGCYLPSLLRPMLSLVRGLAISSDGYFFFPEKVRSCSGAKTSHIFSAKNISILDFMFDIRLNKSFTDDSV